MERPDPIARASANRLAELFRTMPVPHVLGLLGGLLPDLPHAAASAMPRVAPARGDTGIGPWSLVDRNGEAFYEQSSDPFERLHWADVPHIPARAERPRVVLVGESVARGFFHDPDFNFAIALGEALRAGRPHAPLDVVDLARTSIRPEPLVALAESAMKLRPAVVVVFAGNNWHPFDSVSEAERRHLGLRLRDRAELGAVYESLASACRARARDALARLGRISASSGVPIVFMLPDFNLLDWHDPTSRLVPFLPGGADDWFRLTRRLAAALRRQQPKEARRLAERIVALDRGSTAVGLRALARVAASDGDRSQARLYLERARDAVLFTPGWTSQLVLPRCYSATQETVRTHGRECGLHVVDLPAFFDEQYGAVPDRSVFLDHCHLTAEGMRVAAAAAAEQVLRLLGQEPADRRVLLDWPIGVSAERLAWGHVFAACFNGAHGQESCVVAHHCRRAIELAPDIVGDLARLAALHVQAAPAGLTRTCLDLLDRQEWPAPTRRAQRLMFLMGNPQGRRPLAWTLLEAVCATTATAAPGAEEWVHQSVQTVYGVDGRRTIDLLDRRLASTSPYDLESLFRETGNDLDEPLPAQPAYYAAFSPQSVFRLVADCPRAIDFTLTLRIRSATASRFHVRVKVNDALVAVLVAGPRWTRRRFSTGEGLVSGGVNRVTVEWPKRQDPAGFARAAAALADGRVPEFYPSYGDICAFHASASEDRAGRGARPGHVVVGFCPRGTAASRETS